MPELSKTGVYLDTKNNKVVEEPPEEGVQFVAPGGEITADIQADIDRARDLAAGVVSTPETVTTESTGRKPKTAQ